MAEAMNRVAQNLGPFALSLGLLAITVGAVALVLAAMQPAAYAELDVTDETQVPSKPLPTNVTVEKASDPNFEGLEENSVTVVFEDGSANSNTTLSESQNYSVFKDDGIIEYDTVTGYNDSEDQFFVDYTWLDSDTTSHSVIGDGLNAMSDFGGWFGILVIMGVITIIFLFLGVIRRAGTRSMA